MLKGQCILKYLHPKDRLIFANHLSQGLQKQYLIKETKIDEKIIFYVRFREYKSLKDGYGVIDRKTVYKPFQLTCIIRDIPDSLYANKPDNYTDRLVALALPIKSAYKGKSDSYFVLSFCQQKANCTHLNKLCKNRSKRKIAIIRFILFSPHFRLYFFAH